jgi:TATA-box binding protein (TBP) (component of TFIID and TFIIIB)
MELSMMNVDDAWDSFINNTYDTTIFDDKKILNDINTHIPLSSDIYISTKTMITYLNQSININDIFWKIPIMDYAIPTEGVIKKQMKFTSLSPDETKNLSELLSKEKVKSSIVLKHIENPKAIIKYKHIQKINIGLNKKDLIKHRCKEKSAFYNCVALIFRLKYNNMFKEYHLKVFNTGKLEIPGAQNNEQLFKILDTLILTLQPYIDTKLEYNKNKITTVLINSNFNCGYFINRNKLQSKLKIDYNFITMYDPCSYPGIQSKFYYNKTHTIQDGVCKCSKKCGKGGSGNGNGECIEVSFMIFRTGSVLIVGHCEEYVLYTIYKFLKQVFHKEFYDINEGIIDASKKKKKTKRKVKRRYILKDIT